jgi:hypothetical protein
VPPAPAAKEPIATLTFEEGPPVLLKFKFASGDVVDDVVFHDLEKLQSAWKRAGEILQRLVAASPERPVSAQDLKGVLSGMFDAGWLLGRRLANDDVTVYGRVREAFQRSWLTWANPSRDEIPVVQVVGHSISFPLELLPVFSDQEIGDLHNDADLAVAAQRFLGFTAVIRRIAPGASSTPDLLRNKQKLPIQFLRYLEPARKGLLKSRTQQGGFAQEQRFMASLEDALVVDGPWPMSPVTAEQVRQRLAAALFDPSRRLGTADGPPAELTHFACHFEMEGRDFDDCELILSDEHGERVSVTVGPLLASYGRQPNAASARGPRAPVILNACGSSTVDPWSGLSFQEWFIRNNHRAFIGTQAAIPDDAAADFAERFYRFLLGGYTFGEAIVLARRQLLADTKSLLGLLYVLFGNDLLEVEVKNPRILPVSPVV